MLVLIASAALLLFPACSRHHSQQAVSAGRQITDETGRVLTVPQRIDRVVSLAPNLTEIVYAVGAGDRLVGDTTFCDYPPEAKQVEKVGDTLQPNIEKILALRPQVVLISTASQLETFAKQLGHHEIVVYVSDPHDLEGVFRSIETLGQLLNQPDQGKELVGKLRSRVTAMEAAVKGLPTTRVFFQLSAEPLYTAGRDSFVTDLLRYAGGESVTSDVPGAWPKYSGEAAAAAQPEVIILPSGGSMGNKDVAEPLKRSPAVLNGRVYRINDDYLSRPGPRSVDGLEQIARAIHAEAFAK